MERMARAAAACVVALVLAGCGDGDGERAAGDTRQADGTQAAEGPRELRTGAIAPGSYTAESFAVPFSFEVPRGWRAYEYGEDAVTLGRERGGVALVTVRFRVVESVYDPRTSEVVPAPRNLARWLRRHPDLAVRTVRPGELGGLPGAIVRMQAAAGATRKRGCEGPCARVAPPSSGDDESALVVDRSAVELFAAPVGDGRTLTVHVAAPASAFRSEAARIFPTVRFETPS